MKKRFEEAYFNYLVYIENKQKSQSKETIKERFKNRILLYWKNYNIYKINELDYIKWQNEIEKYHYSNNYKKNLHYIISAFFEYLVKYEKVKENIPRKVGTFKNNNVKKEHKVYTYNEFKKFIKCIDNNIYKQFFTLMYFTGVRPGEAMALRFNDIDKRKITINKTISEHHINGKRIIDTPKTRTSNRIIYIDKKLEKDLYKLKKYYINKYNIENYDYFVFGGIKPLAPTTCNRYKEKASKKAEIKQITMHEFRHSHATLLYDKNISVKAIKERLGHSDINTTMNVYIHLYENKEKRVIRTLNFLRLF